LVKLNPYTIIERRQKLREARKKASRTVEEVKRDKKLKAARKVAEHKKNPRKAFYSLLHTPAVAPVRSDLEIGILVGSK